jgi:ribosome-binding factor A
MSNKRLDRMSSQLIREVSDIILRKVSDPRLTWVTVTRASVSPDLQVAKIYITTLEGGEKREAALAALKHAEGFVRHELGGRLELRVTPEVRFFLDEEQAQVEKIYKILDDLKQEPHQDS